jgi:hypothetical protein
MPRSARIPCTFPNCYRTFTSHRGLSTHAGRVHKSVPLHHTPTNNNSELNEEIACDHEPLDQYPNVDDIQERSLDEKYEPFTHEQWWLLDFMSRALVSQTLQTKFYKVTANKTRYK